MNQSLELLENLIKMEEIRDIEWKQTQIALHKGSKAMGESSMLFHLKQLKDLIKQEYTCRCKPALYEMDER